MNKQTKQAIAYAMNALSFLFLKQDIVQHINAIYLFGSAVRGELTKESDIDLFIDCNEEHEKELEVNIKSSLGLFYDSNDYEKWKAFKFMYPLSIQAGNVKTWELYSSILADGITLYSKQIAVETSDRKVLFILELPKNKKKYLSLIRTLFGRKEHGYKDQGIIGEIKGKKLSSNVIIIPQEFQQKIMNIFNKEKVNYTMQEIAISK